MPSKISWLLQGTAFGGFSAVTAFAVWTKHSYWENMDPGSDETFRSASFRKYNPLNNPTFHDSLVRRIPLTKLDPALAKDAERGGDKLVTRFVQGVWGGFGYAPQRTILQVTNKNDSTKDQLWTKQELSQSQYAEGTKVTDHFNVLERPDKNTVIFRCGASPLDHPDGPRPGDGLFEFSAKADTDNGFAEFRLKSVFYQGEGKTDKAPFAGESFMPWAHRQYTKLWMENAVGACKQ